MGVTESSEITEKVDRILELSKIAHEKGTFEGKLKRVYLMNKAKQYRMEQRKRPLQQQRPEKDCLKINVRPF